MTFTRDVKVFSVLQAARTLIVLGRMMGKYVHNTYIHLHLRAEMYLEPFHIKQYLLVTVLLFMVYTFVI